MPLSIIEQSRIFYEERLAKAIERDFPEFADRIAVGIVGEGSDCFGYDDLISQDHDFGVGVCLWLTDEDAPKIGNDLQNVYSRELSEWIRSETATSVNPDHSIRLNQRRGVQSIRQFYSNCIGSSIDPSDPVISDGIWFYTDEWKFATAVNGVVFRDDCGQFTKVRELRQGYYPDRIWKMRLVNALHDYAAAAQVNYARCMARNDLVSAQYCRMRSIDAAINIMFLIRRRFAPYYKWKYRALKELKGSAPLAELIEQVSLMVPDTQAWDGYVYSSSTVNQNDSSIEQFDRIAGLLVDELKNAGLTNSSEIFLEAHCGIIAAGI